MNTLPTTPEAAERSRRGRPARTAVAGFGALAIAACSALAATAPATAADADLPETFLGESTLWSYSDDGTNPAPGSDYLAWTLPEYDDSAWKSDTGAFGAKNGRDTGIGDDFPIDTLLQHYKDGSSAPTIETYHFRTDVDITAEQLEAISGLQGTITYDDAVRVYVNGAQVAGFEDDRVDDVPDEQKNLTYAGNSNGDPLTSTFTIEAEDLRAGENTIAVALYQDRASSSDIYLDFASLEPVGTNRSAVISDIVLGVGATEQERNLVWYSDIDVPQVAQVAATSAVVDGVFPDDALTIAGEGAQTTSGEYFRDATIPGLAESTEYSYRVGSDENGWSDVHTFRTQEFSGDFDFLFFGDPQIGASGNVANDQAGWVDTVNVAEQTYPDAELLFSAGDQVENAANETQYTAFLAPEQLTRIPLVPTNGNHDVGSKAYEQHFNVPNEDLTAGAGSSTTSGGDYWFIYKDVLFVNINSNSRDDESHNAFMEQVVAEHGDEATWKVLAFHHSIYSVASHTNDGDIKDRRDTMPATISELGFDLVLMGHDHSYTRSYLIKDGEVADAEEIAGQKEIEAADGEVLYVTANSASGSKYYGVKAPAAAFASVINQENVRNYSALEVTDESITVRTMRSQESGADKPVNSVVDEVVLTHEAVAASAPEVEATADGDVVTASWSVADDGGAAVTSYDVALRQGETTAAEQKVAGDTTAATFEGVAPGAYTVSVVATNRAGDSEPGVSDEVTVAEIADADTDAAGDADGSDEGADSAASADADGVDSDASSEGASDGTDSGASADGAADGSDEDAASASGAAGDADGSDEGTDSAASADAEGASDGSDGSDEGASAEGASDGSDEGASADGAADGSDESDKGASAEAAADGSDEGAESAASAEGDADGSDEGTSADGASDGSDDGAESGASANADSASDGSDQGADTGAEGDDGADAKPSFTPEPPVASGDQLPADLEGAIQASVADDVLTVSDLEANEWHYLYAYSEPVGLGWFRADADGVVATTIPDGIAAGTHRIAALDAEGALYGWDEISLGAPTAPGENGSNAADGGDSPSGDPLAPTGDDSVALRAGGLLAALLLAGGAVALIGRRRLSARG